MAIELPFINDMISKNAIVVSSFRTSEPVFIDVGGGVGRGVAARRRDGSFPLKSHGTGLWGGSTLRIPVANRAKRRQILVLQGPSFSRFYKVLPPPRGSE